VARAQGGDRVLLQLTRAIEQSKTTKLLRVSFVLALGLLITSIIVGWDWFTTILGSAGILGVSATVVKLLGLVVSLFGLVRTLKSTFPTKYGRTANKVRSFRRRLGG
jgi:hypothetical protein